MRRPPSRLFGRTVEAIHCVGIGGMGLGPLSLYLAGQGYRVSGEDDAMAPLMRDCLERAGIALGTCPEACDLVVCSSAIGERHPARLLAGRRGIPVARRGEVLAESTRDRKLVAVCGSHGKTTSTAMLVATLEAAGEAAGHILGGLFASEAWLPACVGDSEWVVAEVDESDGTISRFSPEITVVLNLDWDHADFYASAAQSEQAFADLASRTRGAVLVSADCAASRRVLPSALTFGREADFSGELVVRGGGGAELVLGGRFGSARVPLSTLGDFNASNALAALATAQLMGCAVSAESLARFPGVYRRQSILHEGDALVVLEDYAHHPSEIRALLTDLRKRMAGAGQGKLRVVFQPHRYSRTARFKVEFADVLRAADSVLLQDVYPANEAPVAGGHASDLLATCRALAPELPVELVANDGEMAVSLGEQLESGDWLAFVGAGDLGDRARVWMRQWRAEQEWERRLEAWRPLLDPTSVLRRDEPLAKHTTLRVGGGARLYAAPANRTDLQTIWRAAIAEQVPVYALGRGSNLIVPDTGVEGVVVSLNHPVWSEFTPEADGSVWVGAGLRLKRLCGLAAKAGLGGIEFLEGIPGSVGGALCMNAGAMGGWMFDLVEEIEFLNPQGGFELRAGKEMTVAYRFCAELERGLAIRARLRPSQTGNAASVHRQIDVYRRKRQESQPREPSAGCIFKNPEGDSAGRLIDEAGLKGVRHGGAEVSAVHANFIINRDHATGGDVLALVREVRARVAERSGYWLEPEARLFGTNWEDVL